VVVVAVVGILKTRGPRRKLAARKFSARQCEPPAETSFRIPPPQLSRAQNSAAVVVAVVGILETGGHQKWRMRSLGAGNRPLNHASKLSRDSQPNTIRDGRYILDDE
jgi:hypothetical protein